MRFSVLLFFCKIGLQSYNQTVVQSYANDVQHTHNHRLRSIYSHEDRLVMLRVLLKANTLLKQHSQHLREPERYATELYEYDDMFGSPSSASAASGHSVGGAHAPAHGLRAPFNYLSRRHSDLVSMYGLTLKRLANFNDACRKKFHRILLGQSKINQSGRFRVDSEIYGLMRDLYGNMTELNAQSALGSAGGGLGASTASGSVHASPAASVSSAASTDTRSGIDDVPPSSASLRRHVQHARATGSGVRSYTPLQNQATLTADTNHAQALAAAQHQAALQAVAQAQQAKASAAASVSGVHVPSPGGRAVSAVEGGGNGTASGSGTGINTVTHSDQSGESSTQFTANARTGQTIDLASGRHSTVAAAAAALSDDGTGAIGTKRQSGGTARPRKSKLTRVLGLLKSLKKAQLETRRLLEQALDSSRFVFGGSSFASPYPISNQPSPGNTKYDDPTARSSARLSSTISQGTARSMHEMDLHHQQQQHAISSYYRNAAAPAAGYPVPSLPLDPYSMPVWSARGVAMQPVYPPYSQQPQPQRYVDQRFDPSGVAGSGGPGMQGALSQAGLGVPMPGMQPPPGQVGMPVSAGVAGTQQSTRRPSQGYSGDAQRYLPSGTYAGSGTGMQR
jgi:hypothetical protein